MSVCDYREPEHNEGESLALPEGVPPLRSFYLYLSSSCNLSCRHCWITPRFVNGQPDPGEIINIKALRIAIEEAKSLGLSSIKLTGGEPMLHPGFREICDLATKEGLNMVMETNGTLLTADMARYLKKETSMDYISISIDSGDPARHDAFRGVKGAFDAVLQGLDHLVTAGYDNTQVIMSVHRGNCDEIEDVARLAAAHGADSVKLNPVTNCGRGADMDLRGETLDFGERLALSHYIFKELDPIMRADGTALDLILYIPPALMPISEFMRRQGDTGDCGILGILGILGSGEIAMCGIGRNIPDLVYGHLGDDSIRDIWMYNPTILKLRLALEDVDNYPDICKECTLASHCRTGCVAQNYVDSKRLVWPDPMCQQASKEGLFPVTRQKFSRSAGNLSSG